MVRGVTPKRAAGFAATAAVLALLIYLIATQNSLGSWILTLAVPIAVVYGIVRRRLSGRSASDSVRPAVQGVNDVQDMVLNRPGIAVTHGTSMGPVATEHDPRCPEDRAPGRSRSVGQCRGAFRDHTQEPP